MICSSMSPSMIESSVPLRAVGLDARLPVFERPDRGMFGGRPAVRWGGFCDWRLDCRRLGGCLDVQVRFSRLGRCLARVRLELAHALQRQQVVGRGTKHVFDLGAGLSVLLQFQESPAERDASREVCGMVLEPRSAHLDGLAVIPCLAELLGEVGKGDRRRVFFNPAPKFVNPMTVRHIAVGVVS